MSVLHSLAEHFHRDALDFAARFDLLWEAGPVMHKMGRTKTFTDLLLGCECALKAHAFLSHLDGNPVEIYRQVRKHGHRIGDLADYAELLDDRTTYSRLKEELAPFPVFLRYSLDAYETFFPSFVDRATADLNYSKTIGNNAWVLQIRECLESMNVHSGERFGGFVTDSLEELFAHEKAMKEFAEACLK
ncbi:MAG: hypothetical protein Q8K12_10285 [Thiobacillus sp.]|nr:hypothetical protein [Thiobacillus sp.]